MISPTNNSKKLTLIALFIAIIIVQNYVPILGYIQFIPGFPQVTIIPITIMVGAVLLGPTTGMWLGVFWGLLSFIMAWTAPAGIGALMFRNPITALVPRLLIGLLIGWLFIQWSNKITSTPKKTGSLIVLGVVGSLINTIGFVISTWLGFSIMHTQFQGIPQQGLLQWLITVVVSFNGVVEAIVAGILLPIIVLILQRFKIK